MEGLPAKSALVEGLSANSSLVDELSAGLGLDTVDTDGSVVGGGLVGSAVGSRISETIKKVKFHKCL